MESWKSRLRALHCPDPTFWRNYETLTRTVKNLPPTRIAGVPVVFDAVKPRDFAKTFASVHEKAASSVSPRKSEVNDFVENLIDL